jgi:predicted glycosyltransferase involved in capsule biosynthesis
MGKNKIDFTDLTFLIPIRIDSENRKLNLEVLIKVLTRDFDTTIIILEAGYESRFLVTENIKNIKYHFEKDDDPIYHKTKYVNQLIRLANTPFVAVWDADAIGIPAQIIDALDALRGNRAIMAYPFDGRFYALDATFSQLFYKTMKYDLLLDNIFKLNLMHGYYSPGGAYLVNKTKYLEAGGENENFYGWGPEDAERIKRMEVLGLNIYYAKGVLFHLWHPRNGWFASKETEVRNRGEFLKTCASKPKKSI